MIVGEDQSAIAREFLCVMNNPRPMLYRLRREGADSSAEKMRVVELAMEYLIKHQPDTLKPAI